VSIISSICSSFFLLRATIDRLLEPFFKQRDVHISHIWFKIKKKKESDCLSNARTKCRCSCCHSRYILVLMVCKRTFVSGGRSCSATQRNLRPARGRYQQNLYWSCFLEETRVKKRQIFVFQTFYVFKQG